MSAERRRSRDEKGAVSSGMPNEPAPIESNGTAPKTGATGRPKTGTVEMIQLHDGSVSVRGRFRYKGERYRAAFGRDVEGWTEQRGRQELKNIHAQLDAGISIEQILTRYDPAPLPALHDYRPGVLFDLYASRWLERMRIGEIGEAPLAENTYADYLWRLSKHILPVLGRIPVAGISDTDCQMLRAKLFADRDRLLKIIEVGGRSSDKDGRLRKPLSLRSIQMVMGLTAQILDDAVEDKLRSDNPARSKRLRVRVPKPDRTFLEIDQLVALLDGAAELEAAPMSNKRAKLTAVQVGEIRARLARGETQYAVRLDYGLSSGSMSMLANGKTYRGDNGRVGWRALCATLLGGAGAAGARCPSARSHGVSPVDCGQQDGDRCAPRRGDADAARHPARPPCRQDSSWLPHRPRHAVVLHAQGDALGRRQRARKGSRRRRQACRREAG
jgi:hypothetical protein